MIYLFIYLLYYIIKYILLFLTKKIREIGKENWGWGGSMFGSTNIFQAPPIYKILY